MFNFLHRAQPQYSPFKADRLGTLAPDPPSQLDILRHDGNPLGMDGTKVGVLKQTYQVGLGRLLKSQDCMALETQISLEVLCNFTDKPLEGKLPDQELGTLLVLTDFTKSHSTRAVAMGLLDSTGGRSRLTGSLGSELLPWSLSSSGLASSLLRTGHLSTNLSISLSLSLCVGVFVRSRILTVNTMAMATSPHSLLLQKPNRTLLKNPISPTTRLNNLHLPTKAISVKCAATAAQTQDQRPLTQTPTQSQDRIFNFAAGPATLPENVLLKAQSELYNWRGSGMSVMEMSHRGKEFLSIIQKAEADLRTLLDIPSEYAVLFLQGGATTQFAAIPLNVVKPDEPVDYLVTGSWGDKAFKEAQKFCKPKVIWSGKSEKYTRIPAFDGLEQSPDAKYLHICANETIHGVEFKDYPTPQNGLLIADMSSNFCSKPVDVSKFGIIYAGAQKNVGPSGVTIVIIRKDLIGNAQEITPIMLDYKIHAENNSLYNTPPCYCIYMCGLVFEDLLEQGGLAEVEKKNKKKAEILYNAIDESNGFYRSPVEKSVRSLMNVPFTLEKPELEADFVKEAAKEKMIQLKGHRSVGGMRASIYNAMPLAGVENLVAFMKDFQARHA